MITSPRVSRRTSISPPAASYSRFLKISVVMMRSGAISVTERAAYIARIRNLSRSVAQAYYESREALGFPMLGHVGGKAA